MELLKLKSFVTTLKIITIVLLLVPFLNPPYGFYIFLKLLATSTFILSIVFHYRKNNTILSGLLFVGVVIFQPLFPIPFEKMIWQIIDVSFSFVLIVSLFKTN